jgi:hypothetical protein
VVSAASEPSARQPEGAVGAAWAAAAQPQGVAAVVWVAVEQPQAEAERVAEALPREGVVEVSDGEAGLQRVVAALAEQVPQREAARPLEQLRAVGPLAVAWVFRRDRALPLPAPPPAARLAHAMASKRVASL